MNLSLIVCTYMRPHALQRLLESVARQTTIPDEVIVVDGSTLDDTAKMLERGKWQFNFRYYSVDAVHRGLTKQRNYGIQQVSPTMDIIAFLDDDLVLESDYFEQLTQTYAFFPDAVGVGGIDLQENRFFKKAPGQHYNSFHYYELDDWVVREPLRYKLRKLAGLMPSSPPGIIPPYSNGRSSFPPNGKTYSVEHLIGATFSFHGKIISQLRFSTFFEGYGLYEDFDFTVRASRLGNLYVNTRAQVWHLHEPSGRPSHFKYGRMVVRNGWYVWRVRFPNPGFRASLQWHIIQWLQILVRFSNVFTGSDRKAAFKEAMGRVYAWLALFFDKPVIE